MTMISKDVRQAIDNLVKSNPEIRVPAAEKSLSESLGVNIEFYARQKRGKPKRIHGNNGLLSLLKEDIYVQLEVGINPDAKEQELLQQYASVRKELDEGTSAYRASLEPLLERFIIELGNLEKRRDFVWAGFVVKDLLPGLGMDVREARTRFDRWADEGILILEKRANPNNPDHPSTCVKLNREHDAVIFALNFNDIPAKPFVPVLIRGEPASTTLIRDR